MISPVTPPCDARDPQALIDAIRAGEPSHNVVQIGPRLWLVQGRDPYLIRESAIIGFCVEDAEPADVDLAILQLWWCSRAELLEVPNTEPQCFANGEGQLWEARRHATSSGRWIIVFERHGVYYMPGVESLWRPGALSRVPELTLLG